MLPVKSFCDRGLKRTGLEIVREHRRPCDGLQRRPMRAQHRREREDEKDFAEPLEHINKLNCRRKSASP